jgi:FkbM family methyltransferase
MLVLEPQPVLFQQLCANLALNGLMHVRALPFAGGATDGEVCFETPDYESTGNFGAATMLPRLPGSTDGRTQAVPCYRLDTLVREEQVALIKLDVEGAELDVLRGAEAIVQRDRPVLYLENDRVALSEALIAWLFAHGYRLWWYLAPLFHENNFLGNKENIYGDLVSMNMIALHPAHGAVVDGLPEVLHADEHPLKQAVVSV